MYLDTNLEMIRHILRRDTKRKKILEMEVRLVVSPWMLQHLEIGKE